MILYYVWNKLTPMHYVNLNSTESELYPLCHIRIFRDNCSVIILFVSVET